MNKFANMVMVGVLILTVLAGYWYVKPDQMPAVIGDLVPGLKGADREARCPTFGHPVSKS